MKSQSYRPDISEMPPYRLGRHWNTIQTYLIPGLEDGIGELSEELKKLMGICELLIDKKISSFVAYYAKPSLPAPYPANSNPQLETGNIGTGNTPSLVTLPSPPTA